LIEALPRAAKEPSMKRFLTCALVAVVAGAVLTDVAHAQKPVKNIGKAREEYIQSARSGLNLDADTTTKGNGAKVQLWQSNGAAQQKWRLKDAGGGLYYIQSVNNGLYLDADTTTKGNGAKVQLWQFNGQAQQKWRLTSVPGEKGSLGSGLHYIQSVSNGLYLDADTTMKGNGTKVQLWQSNGQSQ
jgi:endo-1,4-beta-xylanase